MTFIMKHFSFLILLAVFASGCFGFAQKGKIPSNTTSMNKASIHSYSVKDIEGNDFDFAGLKGKKIMIVNTASKCGFTPQYKDLENVYQTYKDKGFVIIGFPANNFLNQEPGSNEEIASFCEVNYGVSFPMMSKISVKGKDIHPVYEFLTMESKNGV